MPLDTRMLATAAPGYVPPLDPAQVVGRGLGLAQAYRQSQVGQMQLAEAQRAERERGTLAAAFRGALVTDPATGETRVDMPRAFSEAYRTTSDPLTVFKAQQAYEKQQAGSAKDTLEARKVQLETAQKRNDYVSQLANGLLAVEEQGGDVQAAYQQTMRQAAQDLGVAQIPGMPPTYDRSVVLQLAAQGQTYNEGIKNQLERTTQQLREYEIANTTQRTALERRRLDLQERKDLREAAKPDVSPGQKLQDALLARHGARPAGQGYTQEEMSQAAADVVANERAISEGQGLAGAVAKPLEGPALQRVNMLMQGEDVVKALHSEFTPEERARYVGLGGLRMTMQQAQQLLSDAQGGKGDPKFARFVALVALGKQEAFSTAGQAMSAQERDVVYGYIPTGREWSAEEFEQKLKLSGDRLPTLIDRELTLSTTPRSELAARRKRGELPSLAPGSPASTPATQDKVLTEADIATTLADEQRKGTPKTRQQLLDAARKKGWTVPEQ